LRAAIRVATVLGILVLSVPAPASAEWHLTPLLGLTFQGETTIFDPQNAVGNLHWNFGGALTLLGAGPLGVEALVVYTPSFFQADQDEGDDVPPVPITGSRSVVVMGNVVLAAPRSWNEYGLRPFVSGGLGLLHASASDARELLPVQTNLLAYNIGGGAVGFLTARTGLRFDLRYFRNLKDSDDPDIAIDPVQLSYWTASIGVVFRY
jgi:hypothetical protein